MNVRLVLPKYAPTDGSEIVFVDIEDVVEFKGCTVRLDPNTKELVGAYHGKDTVWKVPTAQQREQLRTALDRLKAKLNDNDVRDIIV